MRKGCFIKMVVVVTIIVAAIVYLVKNNTINLYSLFSSKIKEEFKQNFDSSYVNILNKGTADSLRTMLNARLDEVKNFNDIQNHDFNEFLTYFKMSSKDSLIDSVEFNNLKNILENERPKKK
ncbi:MAG TPA: hypothetical protein VFF33_02470 [Ignavibacteriaceae bacterium]|nr:hypothetical protein [Ignavibacteriaceae bacterium]